MHQNTHIPFLVNVGRQEYFHLTYLFMTGPTGGHHGSYLPLQSSVRGEVTLQSERLSTHWALHRTLR